MFKQLNEPRVKPSAIKRKALDPIKNRNEGNISTTQNFRKQLGNNHSQMCLVKSNSPTTNTKKGIFPRRLQENLETQKKSVSLPSPSIPKMRASQSQSQIPRLMKLPPSSTPIAKSSVKKIKIIKNVIEKSHSQLSIKITQRNKSSQVEQTHAEELKEIPKPKNKSSQCDGLDSELCDPPSTPTYPAFSGIDVIANIVSDIINQLNLKKAEKNIMKKHLPGFYMALPNFQGSVLSAFRSPNKTLQFAWFRTTDFLAKI